MARYYYDLHIHSCLSPCADNENTPFNLIGMGVLAGLQIMALTDHNTCRNCPAFFAAAKEHGIVPVPGMELTTAEDVHVVCLFKSLEDALCFDQEIDGRRIKIPNRTDIFGEQWVCNEQDEPTEQEPHLLSNATTVSLDEAWALVESYGGVCYPAHIDREANGILAVLGMMPPTPIYSCVEFHNAENVEPYRKKYGLSDVRAVIDSDAHLLWSIRDKENFLDLETQSEREEDVRAALIETLRSKGGESR